MVASGLHKCGGKVNKSGNRDSETVSWNVLSLNSKLKGASTSSINDSGRCVNK